MWKILISDLCSECPDGRTKELLKISIIYDLTQFISQPTRISNNNFKYFHQSFAKPKMFACPSATFVYWHINTNQSFLALTKSSSFYFHQFHQPLEQKVACTYHQLTCIFPTLFNSAQSLNLPPILMLIKAVA